MIVGVGPGGSRWSCGARLEVVRFGGHGYVELSTHVLPSRHRGVQLGRRGSGEVGTHGAEEQRGTSVDGVGGNMRRCGVDGNMKLRPAHHERLAPPVLQHVDQPRGGPLGALWVWHRKSQPYQHEVKGLGSSDCVRYDTESDWGSRRTAPLAVALIPSSPSSLRVNCIRLSPAAPKFQADRIKEQSIFRVTPRSRKR